MHIDHFLQPCCSISGLPLAQCNPCQRDVEHGACIHGQDSGSCLCCSRMCSQGTPDHCRPCSGFDPGQISTVCSDPGCRVALAVQPCILAVGRGERVARWLSQPASAGKATASSRGASSSGLARSWERLLCSFAWLQACCFACSSSALLLVNSVACLGRKCMLVAHAKVRQRCSYSSMLWDAASTAGSR